MTNQLSLAGRPVAPPVVLAPMAGITNLPFRKLCREQSTFTARKQRREGAGIYVCEMITTVALTERNPKTMRLIEFDPEEETRSLQLYGVDPEGVRKAVRMIVAEDLADHVDLNFGCPVPKVTRRGGGSALPWKRRLFREIVTAAVDAAEHLPVTVKMRKGIDDDHLTYREAGEIAQDAGVAWVALHGRTAAERYSGTADWEAIADLKSRLEIPVLGNGDVWEADDALRMVAETGCDGVVVGRGCLGRPWLFGDLEAAFNGRSERRMPPLGEVAKVMLRHAALLVEWIAGAESYEARRNIAAEEHGCREFRKHVAWYLKGFPVGGELRRALSMVSTLNELEDLLGKLDADAPFPESTIGKPRGRTNSPGKVSLPDGWLEDRDDRTVPVGAEIDSSGG
ncbi:tRNA dihydrouridine synthase DusB [Glycomyces paridis]|uniref:tRNA dihydrouridine synthase DusB n=1 Tax=Glycomyces paridis TaxID=2126555 RepID=A0A4S8PSR0_9ACTN|nr:tRNA dihydrouridine synthase DusB [Glycomyces paridis]THV31419.1 tRNA dihydrouridine synthase DusB [Glycomyces paridis]